MVFQKKSVILTSNERGTSVLATYLYAADHRSNVEVLKSFKVKQIISTQC